MSYSGKEGVPLVTAQLICAFVFAKSRSSHDEAQWFILICSSNWKSKLQL